MHSNNIKLLASGRSGSHGFSETHEGRRFLRFCYGRYIAIKRQPDDGSRATAHGKVAEIVAEDASEVKATTQALRRWSEDIQSDIWANNTIKSAHIARKIESLITTEPPIAQLIDDRAAGIRASDFTDALTVFFYPASRPYEKAIGTQLLQRYAGIFTIWVYSGDSDRYRDYYYQSDIHVLNVPHDRLPIMITHEFSIRYTGTRPIIYNRRSGFCSYGEDGSAVQFLMNYSRPSERWVEFLNIDNNPTDAPGVRPTDRRYDTDYMALSPDGASGYNHKLAALYFNFRSVIPRKTLLLAPTAKIIEGASMILGETSWDIML